MTRPLIPGSSDRTFSFVSDPMVANMPSTGRVIPVQFQRHGVNGAHPHQSLNGSTSAAAINAVLANDPLAGMTAKQIFFDCVWLSNESTTTKIMLLCIGRFFDDNACSSSMSYAQVARECGLHEVTAKKTANAVRDRWLRIGVGKGFYVPGKGAQNLYHGICPPELVERLREEKRKGRAVPRDPEVERAAEAAADRVKSGVVSDYAGVASDYPEPQSGVVSGYPEGDRGSPGLRPGLPRTTRTQIDSEEDKSLSGAGAPGVGATKNLFSEGAPDQGSALPDGAPTSTKADDCKPKKPAKISDAEIEAGFLEWYAAYPRKEAPKDAKRAYARIIKSGEATIPQLLAAVRAYKFAMPPLKGERDFRPHPATWLNGGRWQVVGPQNTTAGSDAADPNAALKHLVASPFGQRTLEREGHEEGMKTLRARLAANKKGASDA